MANKLYQRGRTFEYERRRHYMKEGYTVMRTAGSHGPFDLVCLRAHTPPLLVQCKVTISGVVAKRAIAGFKREVKYGRFAGTPCHQRIDVKILRKKEVMSWTC